jgi:DNA-directed RNA polymerase specialized sigma24 family protein
MIDGIEGGSAKETEKLRAVLKKVVLEGAPAAEARDSLGGSSTERMQLWFKARSRLLAHLDHLLESLSRYRADLNG